MKPQPDDPGFEIGPWVPLVSVRVALAVLGVAVSAALLPGNALPVGVLLALVAAVRPPAAWLLIVLLAIGEVVRSAVGPGLLLLIAAIHLLHLLAAAASALPMRGRLQLAALLRPLGSALLLEVPLQAAGVAVLLLGHPVALAGWGVAGAVALVAVVTLLAVALRRAGPA